MSVAEAEAALKRFDGAAALELLDGDESHQATALRVRALWLQRRWDEARATLASLDGVDDIVDVWLARGAVALGQPDEPSLLTATSPTALRDDSLALQVFIQAVARFGKSAEAQAGYLTALRMAGRRTVPLHTEMERQLPILLERVMEASERGDDGRALELVRLALDADPDCVHAAVLEIDILRRVGVSLARARAEELVRRQPQPSGNMLELLAWTIADTEDMEDPAVRRRVDRLFRQAFDIGPAAPGVICGLATILQAAGDVEGALDLVDDAIEREPTSPQLHLFRAHLQEDSVASARELIPHYERARELDPRGVEARARHARALYAIGDVDKARRILEPALNDFPRNTDIASAWAEVVGDVSPWEMPEPYKIKTRLSAPWRTGDDDPDQVLKLLTDEVADRLAFSPEVARRLHERVSREPAAILDQATAQRTAYDEAKSKQLRLERFTAMWVALRYLGMALGMVAVLVSIAAALLFTWRVVGTLDVALVWRVIILIVFWVLLLGAFFRAVDEADSDAMVWVIGAAMLALIPGGLIWEGVVRFGGWTGALAGIGATVVVAGFLLLWLYLLDELDLALHLREAQEAFDEWLESLYGNGLLRIAPEVSNSLGVAFSTSLPHNSKRVVGRVVHVDTDAVRELTRLGKLGKGSFALAGPRGVGKSTLLKLWCEGAYLSKTTSDSKDLSMVVDAPVGYNPEEFLIHLYSRLCDAAEDYVRKHDSKDIKVRRWFRRAKQIDDEVTTDKIQSMAGLRRLARNERDKLRYSVSRTQEGEVSATIAKHFGVKGKVSQRRDEIPLNHPQRVDQFRAFLGRVAEFVGRENQSAVLIGIDELDRISDGDKAQRFLNELKAVFDVKNCFFLVSVSEDALADFELSAMGMRTVFDSAFDAIVRVDYLSFDEAKVLLKQVMLEIPEQFVALAYVLSGGLTRELMRIADIMGDVAADARSLPQVTAELVGRQLRSTARAAMDRLTRARNRSSGAALIPVLDKHPVKVLNGQVLRQFAAAVENTKVGRTAEPVRRDVVVRVEYLATLLDVFDHQLDEERMRTGLGDGPGEFETLARVRRYLGANPYGARELLDSFARAWESTPA